MSDFPARRSALGTALLFAVSLFAALLLGEALLSVAGVEPRYHTRVEVPDTVPWWRCDDERGCRYDRRWVDDPGRYNVAGFRDADPFRPPEADDGRTRILLLGDSFAFGASAYGAGESFAEIVEAKLSALLWNTGIPGNGQREELAALRELQPLLAPDQVLLAFYMNDFQDNLYPPGRHLVFADGSWVLRYERREGGGVRKMGPDEAYRRAAGLATTAQQRLATTRVGTLLRRGVRRVTRSHSSPPPSEVQGRRETRELLAEIRDTARTGGSDLVVLVVPSRADLAAPSAAYEASRELCRELDLHCLEVRHLLTPDDYDRDHPLDSHWTPRGHAKIGDFLADALRPTGTAEEEDS